MGTYQRILAVVDLESQSVHIARHAQSLARELGAELRLVHVVPPLALSTPMAPAPVAPETVADMIEVVKQAEQQLAGVAREVGLTDDQCEVLEGSVREQILNAARDWPADLVVIGSRQRHGLAKLVTSTEGAVAQRAPCDVLEVRLRD